MERPVIVIDDKVIEMPTPKARLWRELIKFEEERKALTVEDFCDAHIEMLARAFGVSADEICDSLRVDEVLPLYMSVLTYIMQLLTAKLTVSKKNEPEEGRGARLTAYEGVLSCFLFAIKTLNSSFAEVDAMQLETLAELISVYDKLTDDPKARAVFIDDIL